MKDIPQSSSLIQELIFTASRSSGPGGQNVNKVNSKVTLKWDILKSNLISDEQKKILIEKVSSLITTEGVLMLTSQDKRSQLDNKESVLHKLDRLLLKALVPVKARKATKPTKSSSVKRVEAKKHKGEKKSWRRRVE